MVLKDSIHPMPVPPAEAMALVRRLQQEGFDAVFAGGCVRDALLGKVPHDWDIATSATPDQVEALFAPHTIPVGKQFGIIVVIAPSGTNYEIATFRGDSEYADGRHPGQIRFVPMKEDVQRRDFTVNALLWDPLSQEIHDFVGGIDDLRAGILRTVGQPDCRFAEDKLRVLRGVRFAANLEFAIAPKTWQAIRQTASQVKAAVSPERIAAEMDKMLLAGHAAKAMMLLEQSGLLATLFPELAACIGVEQPPQFHPEGDVWQHTVKMLGFLDQTVMRCRNSQSTQRFDQEKQLAQASETELRALAWGSLLHDIGKPGTFVRGEDRIHFNGHDALGAVMAVEFLKRLKFSNSLVDAVKYLVAGHMNVITLPQARLATRKRHYMEPLFPLLLEISRLDSLASFGDLNKQQQVVAEWQDVALQPPPLKPTLTGYDLLSLGVKPSPRFGLLLKLAYDHELETPFHSHKEAMEWLKQEIKKQHLEP